MTDDPVVTRRLARLREELLDESIPVPLEGACGVRMLAEINYARRPPRHESRMPTYGSLVFEGPPDWDSAAEAPSFVSRGAVGPATLRRCADGRSSFTVVTPEGVTGLALFDRAFDDELAAVRLQRCGAVVVQRSRTGMVRVCTGTDVVGWDGSTWLHKPLADEYVTLIKTLAPHADGAVLTGLLELSVHALAAARVGATMVWNLDGHPVDDRRDGLVEHGQAVRRLGLSVTRRVHFPALVSLHSQVDLATVIGVDGVVGPIGVRLNSSRRARSIVPASWGARHTSARRFSFDVPGVLVLVVSESGRVTVFSGGGMAARITDGRRGDESSPAVPEDDCRATRYCPVCERPILITMSEAARSVDLVCPVCDSPLALPGGGRVVGVPLAVDC